jgi:hypothetical protein
MPCLPFLLPLFFIVILFRHAQAGAALPFYRHALAWFTSASKKMCCSQYAQYTFTAYVATRLHSFGLMVIGFGFGFGLGSRFLDRLSRLAYNHRQFRLFS